MDNKKDEIAINAIVKLAASALPGEKKYVLFAGAGVSKDAGIPTAWDLMIKTASLLYANETENQDKNIDLARIIHKNFA